MQESIIVYRSPLEKALWEGTLFGDNTFPIMIAAVGFLAGFVAVNWVMDKFVWKTPYKTARKLQKYQTQISCIGGAVAAFAVYKFMAI